METLRLFAAALLLLAAAGAAVAQRPKAVEVAPGVWMVQGESAMGSAANRNFISNAAFVVTADRVVVIDALGSPALAEELLEEIRRITPLPVRHVIVTHYHADHVYGLQVFQAEQLRGIKNDVNRGRRVLAQPVKPVRVAGKDVNPPADGAAPMGSVPVAADGSVAALVRADRATTWQLVDSTKPGDPMWMDPAERVRIW